MAVFVTMVAGCSSSPPAAPRVRVWTPPVLAPNGGLSGRALFEGAPVDDVVIGIVRQSWTMNEPEVYERHTVAGRFEIARLQPGEVTVIVVSRGTARLALLHQEIRTDAALDLGDVVLPKGFTIKGTIRNEAGVSVASADVSLEQHRVRNRSQASPSLDLVLGNLRTTSDLGGDYEIRGFTSLSLSGSGGELRARAADGRISWTRWVPADNATEDLVVSPVGAIHGTATPGRDNLVFLHSVASRRDSAFAVITGGAFDFRGVPVGNCVASLIGQPAKTVTVVAGKTTQVSLP
jgi:hypothetical protein